MYEELLGLVKRDYNGNIEDDSNDTMTKDVSETAA